MRLRRGVKRALSVNAWLLLSKPLCSAAERTWFIWQELRQRFR